MRHTPLDFQGLHQALQTLDLEMGVAECHGLLCGTACAAGGLEAAVWRARLSEQAPVGDLLAKEALEQWERVRATTLAALGDSNLAFAPLLAADDAGLEGRVNGLAEWCQGFLLGMGEGGLAKEAELPSDSREFLADLVQMSRADGFDLEGGEEDEQALFELEEYLRTGVLLLNEELHPTQAPPITATTLH